MIPLSIIGLFCEDIRIEKGDSFTLIGLLPDNISVEASPPTVNNRSGIPTIHSKLLLRICVFARANFDPGDTISRIELQLTLANAQVIPIGGASAEIIEKARAEAKEKSNPLAGVIMSASLDGFRPPSPGLVKLEASVTSNKRRQRRLLAALHFKDATSANVAEPQA